jgi:hypothetical protein
VQECVLYALACHVRLVEGGGDGRVALPAASGDFLAPRDAVGVERLGEGGQDLAGVAVANDEVAVALAIPRPERVERVEHERDAGRSRVGEYVAVEDEDGDDGAVSGRRGEAGVVRGPEVPAMPVECHTRSSRDCSLKCLPNRWGSGCSRRGCRASRN